jgi:lipoprotein-anchoring transpeptidase ErfK/SrfK
VAVTPRPRSDERRPSGPGRSPNEGRPSSRAPRRRPARTGVVLAVLAVGLLALAAGGLYAYDASHADRIAQGVSVAGVDVGGMPVSAARSALKQQVASPLARPIRVSAAGTTYKLSARRAHVRADVEGMTADALAAGRGGNFASRAWRDATGGREDARLPARVSYSKRAVAGLVQRVEQGANRPAQDAKVDFTGGTITKVASHTGRELRTTALSKQVRRRIARPEAPRLVRASFTVSKPKVTKGELTKKYPVVLMVNRGGFKLSYYRRLKLIKSYRIAVGKVGLETPAGLYHVQNKAVNPDWNVPNSDWAGDKAGKVIPGGTSENPLKARWLGIFDGAGIHGTSEVGSLGSNASHGCIRMSIPEVIELYKKVPVNAPVYIQ